MSGFPPSTPPGGRPRSRTLPGSVDAAAETEWKVHVKRDIQELQRVDTEALRRLESMDKSLTGINTTLSELVAARSVEEKRTKFWERIKSGVLMLLIGIGLTQLGKLAAIVQAAHTP